MLEWLLAPLYEVLARMLSFLGLASAATSLEQKGTQVGHFSAKFIALERFFGQATREMCTGTSTVKQ